MTKSDRALAFAKSMLIHGDAVRAAADAGYEGNENQLRVRAKEMMKHPDVREILGALKRKDVLIAKAQEIAARDALSADELDSRDGRAAWLKRVVRGEFSETHVGKEGPVDIETPMKDRIAAMKLLGTMHGDYVTRIDVSVHADAMVFELPDNGRGAHCTKIIDTTAEPPALPTEH